MDETTSSGGTPIGTQPTGQAGEGDYGKSVEGILAEGGKGFGTKTPVAPKPQGDPLGDFIRKVAATGDPLGGRGGSLATGGRLPMAGANAMGKSVGFQSPQLNRQYGEALNTLYDTMRRRTLLGGGPTARGGSAAIGRGQPSVGGKPPSEGPSAAGGGGLAEPAGLQSVRLPGGENATAYAYRDVSMILPDGIDPNDGNAVMGAVDEGGEVYDMMESIYAEEV